MPESKNTSEEVRPTEMELPDHMVYIIQAKSKRCDGHGSAIIGAASKETANYVARNDGWLNTAIITETLPFLDYCRINRINDEELYEKLRSENKWPAKIGEWNQIEWIYLKGSHN